MNPQVNAENDVNEAHQQNVYVPRAHQQTKILRNDFFVGKIDAHQFSRDEKNDENGDPENQVNVRHSFLRLTQLKYNSFYKSKSSKYFKI